MNRILTQVKTWVRALFLSIKRPRKRGRNFTISPGTIQNRLAIRLMFVIIVVVALS